MARLLRAHRWLVWFVALGIALGAPALRAAAAPGAVLQLIGPAMGADVQGVIAVSPAWTGTAPPGAAPPGVAVAYTLDDSPLPLARHVQAPYGLLLDTSSIAPGPHVLRVDVEDADGQPIAQGYAWFSVRDTRPLDLLAGAAVIDASGLGLRPNTGENATARLAAALRASAAAHAWLRLAPGRYRISRLALPDGARLLGQPGVVLESVDGGPLLVSPPGGASGVAVVGLCLEGARPGVFAVDLQHAADVTLAWNEIAESGAGVRVLESRSVHIYGNRFRDLGSRGLSVELPDAVYVGNSSDVEVTRNLIAGGRVQPLSTQAADTLTSRLNVSTGPGALPPGFAPAAPALSATPGASAASATPATSPGATPGTTLKAVPDIAGLRPMVVTPIDKATIEADGQQVTVHLPRPVTAVSADATDVRVTVGDSEIPVDGLDLLTTDPQSFVVHLAQPVYKAETGVALAIRSADEVSIGIGSRVGGLTPQVVAVANKSEIRAPVVTATRHTPAAQDHHLQSIEIVYDSDRLLLAHPEWIKVLDEDGRSVVGGAPALNRGNLSIPVQLLPGHRYAVQAPEGTLVWGTTPVPEVGFAIATEPGLKALAAQIEPDGTHLTLTFDQALLGVAQLQPEQFTLAVGADALTPAAVVQAANTNALTLTLPSPVYAGEGPALSLRFTGDGLRGAAGADTVERDRLAVLPITDLSQIGAPAPELQRVDPAPDQIYAIDPAVKTRAGAGASVWLDRLTPTRGAGTARFGLGEHAFAIRVAAGGASELGYVAPPGGLWVFTARVGLDPAASVGARAQFSLLVDDEVAVRTQALAPQGEPVLIQTVVPAGSTLTLRTVAVGGQATTVTIRSAQFTYAQPLPAKIDWSLEFSGRALALDPSRISLTANGRPLDVAPKLTDGVLVIPLALRSGTYYRLQLDAGAVRWGSTPSAPASLAFTTMHQATH